MRGKIVLVIITVFLFLSLLSVTFSIGQETPKYGGTITFQVNSLRPSMDPTYLPGLVMLSGWFESLFFHDWALDRSECDFKAMFVPKAEYYQGQLAESWEQNDPTTITIHVRKGVHWHDKPPVNGREFTSYDVENTFHRVLGRGSGYTEPSRFVAQEMTNYDSVTATDKYTVVIKFKKPLNIVGLNDFFSLSARLRMGAPEMVKLEGGLKDWKKTLGTGPWMLTDLIPETSMTLTKNPSYYGFDERSPKNRLPYADEIRVLNIPDEATAVAALRTGKIDILPEVKRVLAASLAKTNPELKQSKLPFFGMSIEMRVDKKPFNDIKVRKALQMSLDRKTIARVFYGGAVDGTPVGVMTPKVQKGWCTPYEQWPRELQEEYSYNPEKAKMLLAEAGYPNGFKTHIVAGANEDLELVELIKSQFKDIGVEMEIKVMEPTAKDAFLRADKQDQMNTNRFTGTVWPPGYALIIAYSKNMNHMHINDPVYDEMFENLGVISDPAAAVQNVKNADMYILKKHWGVYVVPSVNYFIYQPYIKGYGGELPYEYRFSYLARYWKDK